MSPIIHGCVGWLIGHRSSSRRVRAVCTIAAVAPDIDGAGLLISDDLYLAWHHRLAHGMAFAVATAVLAALVCRRERPVRAAGLAVLAFHSHIAMDLVGSGPGWPILYWWPWSTAEWLPSWQWDLASWQNSLFGLVVVLACLATARTVGRTPVELFSPRADRRVVDTIVARFKSTAAAIEHQR
jgi:inner membrane protein